MLFRIIRDVAKTVSRVYIPGQSKESSIIKDKIIKHKIPNDEYKDDPFLISLFLNTKKIIDPAINSHARAGNIKNANSGFASYDLKDKKIKPINNKI